MNLTSEQRSRLDELAGDLSGENPRLARALAGGWYVVRRRCAGPPGSRRGRCVRALDWPAVAATVVAAPLLVVGIVLAQPALIALGLAALVNVLVRCTAVRQRPPAA